MITEDYVSFETAKLLKEKGFNEDITTYRDDFIQHGNIVIPLQECLSDDKVKTPTLQMAMKWLREVHNLFIELIVGENYGKFWYDFDAIPINGKNIEWDYYNNIPTKEYSSPEEACESAIKYCLENLI